MGRGRVCGNSAAQGLEAIVRNTRGAGIVLVMFAVSWLAAACLASGVDTTNPNLPPDTGEYVGGRIIYNGPGLTVLLQDIHLHPLAATATRTSFGADEIELFNATLNAQISVNSSPPVATSAAGQERTITHGKVGNTTGTFATEMLELNLAGSSP